MTAHAFPLSSAELAVFFAVPNGHYDDLALFAQTTRYIGFSVQRTYPPDSAFRPAIGGKGNPDSVVLIHVGIPVLDAIEPTAFPLLLKASKYSKYLQNHLDYDDDDPLSPTTASVLESKKSKQPIDLDFTGEYELVVESPIHLVHKLTRQPISPAAVLENAFEQHCNTTNVLNRHRLKVQSRRRVDYAFEIAIRLCKWILQSFFDFQLEENRRMFSGLKPYERSALKRLSVDSVKIFNYQASKRSVVYFSFLAIFLYWICRFFNLPYDFFHSVFSSPFLSICCSVVLLWAIDDGIPLCFFWFMNQLIRLRSRIIYG